MKKGGLDGTLFSFYKYQGKSMTAEDPYDRPGQLKLRQHGQPQTASEHNRAFKPSFNGSKVKHSEYPHFKEFDDKVYKGASKRPGF